MDDLLTNFLNWLTQQYHAWKRKRVGEVLPSGWVVGTGVAARSAEAELVTLSDQELAHHIHVVGGSGSGKSKSTELLVREHIQQGAGFCLVDPHGDLIEAIVAYLAVERRNKRQLGEPFNLRRVVLVEPFRESGIIGINPLDPGGGPLHPHIGELIAIFRRFWSSSWGPRMEELLRNSLLALALTGNTLVEVIPFLSDAAFRTQVLSQVEDEAVTSYFRDRYDALADPARQTMAEPVMNKMGALLGEPRLRATFGQREGTLNLRQLMDEGAWVLLNCAKGYLRDASYILGSFIVAQIQAAAMGRAEIPEAERRPFTLLVDEFQNFRGEDFETILCEARKYKLRLVLIHQHLGQLDPSLRNTTFGNVATRLIFAVSATDAALIARGLPDEAGMLPNLTQQSVGHALLFRRGQPIQPVKILPVQTPTIPRTRLLRFATALRRQYGRDLPAIEAELRSRRVGETRQLSLPTGGRRCKSLRSTTAPSPAPSTPSIKEAADD